ncbi:hypothetical protein TYRP_020095 [Tyrophagus putrescentiae]|nr:hypothetical protein TYRP_020095 [Tyrophagus putrescentiae]
MAFAAEKAETNIVGGGQLQTKHVRSEPVVLANNAHDTDEDDDPDQNVTKWYKKARQRGERGLPELLAEAEN